MILSLVLLSYILLGVFNYTNRSVLELAQLLFSGWGLVLFRAVMLCIKNLVYILALNWDAMRVIPNTLLTYFRMTRYTRTRLCDVEINRKWISPLEVDVDRVSLSRCHRVGVLHVL